MKRVLQFFILASMISIFLSGCLYDNLEDLYPEGGPPCDTANVTFSGTVWPIINDHCVGCHSGGTPSGGIALETYDQIKNYALIQAGNYGSLMGVISHAPGNSPMPKGQEKLSDCAIRQVEIWIEEGTPDN